MSDVSSPPRPTSKWVNILSAPARGHDSSIAAHRRDLLTRSTGLGHVVLDRGLAQRRATVPADAAVFVAGRQPHGPSGHAGPGARAEYLGTVRTLEQSGAWGMSVVVGLWMHVSPRSRSSTPPPWPRLTLTADSPASACWAGRSRQAIRMVALELARIVTIGLASGCRRRGRGDGRAGGRAAGSALTVTTTLVAGLAAGAALLGLAAGVVTARSEAIRVAPAAAMRVEGWRSSA